MKIQKYTVLMVKDSNYHIRKGKKPITSPEVVVQVAKSYFKNSDREHFICFALDTRNNIIGLNTVSIGCVDSTIVHPREVFKFAILANATVVIFAHNHPSGDANPSSDDIAMTKRLQEAGKIIGIEVIDHIIIGDGIHKSMKAAGLI